jgi:20S proteasome alpha/beta subunit
MSLYLSILVLYLWVCYGALKASDNDLSLFEYTENGEVSQLLYGRRAIERYGCPVVAFHCPSLSMSVVIVGIKRFSSLHIPDENHTLFCKEGVLAALTGYAPDVTDCRSYFNSLIVSHKYTFGEVPSICKLANSLAHHFTEGMYRDGKCFCYNNLQYC